MTQLTMAEAAEARSNMEAKRQPLLAETDLWGISDYPATQEQLAYRQALRDITTHANWPNLVDGDWPTKPTSGA